MWNPFYRGFVFKYCESRSSVGGGCPGASRRHLFFLWALISGLFRKLIISTHTKGSWRPGEGLGVGEGSDMVLTVIAVVIHQDDLFYEVGRAFLKHTEETEK